MDQTHPDPTTPDRPESETRLRLFIDQAPAAIAMFDREMRYVSASRRWLVECGLEGTAILGRRHAEVLPDWPLPWADYHRKCLSGIPITREEDTLPRPDGRLDWLRWAMHPWRDATGAVGGTVMFLEVVTGRKRAEESERQLMAERASRGRILDVLESISDAFVAVDRDWRFTFVNREAERMLRRTQQDLVGRQLWEEFPEAADHPLHQAMVNAFEDLVPLAAEEFYPPAGRWFEVRVYPSRESLSIYLRDVTRRRQAAEIQARLQEAVQLAATEWQGTFDTIEAPVVLVDRQGRIARMNRAALQVAGAAAELEGRSLDTLAGVLWPRAAALARRVWQTRALGQDEVTDESTGRTWGLDATLFSTGELEERVILVARDVTQVIRLQESLHRSERMSAMGSLVAGVAHQVRNPLFGITLTLDALQARLDGRDDLTRYFSVLEEQVGRVNAVMQDLLDYGKPATAVRQPGDLREVIARVMVQLTPHADAAKVRLVLDATNDLPPLPMDPNRIPHIFQNLIDNAMQHSPTGGTVRVVARMVNTGREQRIRCEVSDQGSGFGPEDLARAFEPFYTRRQGGTGLGLAIVQRIVDEHGGRVWAGNQPGGGGLVTVDLPVAGS